jgi:hypothetical protein
LTNIGASRFPVGNLGWKGKENGELLEAAEKEFEALVTVDRGMPHQQNLARFDLAIVLLEAKSNSYDDLAPLMERANAALLREARPGRIFRVIG